MSAADRIGERRIRNLMEIRAISGRGVCIAITKYQDPGLGIQAAGWSAPALLGSALL